MAQAETRYVVPGKSGGWDVKAPKSERASSHHATQAEAISAARTYVTNKGGGEIVIFGADGKIRKKDTVGEGNDPRNRKG